MYEAYGSRVRFRIAAAVLLLQSTAVVSAACYATPQAAIHAAHSAAAPALKEDKSGYRVVSVRIDPLLGQNWATVVRCDHPEWPAVAMLASTTPLAASAQLRAGSDLSPVIVHAGETVRLWRRESLMQIEVAGIAEQNGILGKTVRVRLLRRDNDGSSSSPEEISGVVQGPADVEMQP